MGKLTAIAAITLLATTVANAAVIYTPTKGPTCRDHSKEEFGDWTCPGPAGYAARFTDEGNIAGVSIGPKSRIGDWRGTQMRGAGKVFGDKIEWHVIDGVVKSAVLRIWAIDENEKEVQTLEVFLLEPGHTCSFGSINARQPDANEIAFQRAEAAAYSSCKGR